MSTTASEEKRKPDPDCEFCNGSGRLGSTDDDTGERVTEDCACVDRAPAPPTWAELAESCRLARLQSEKTLAALQEATRLLGVRS